MDPINLPKFWVLMSLGIATSFMLIIQPKSLISKSNWPIVVSSGSVIVCMFLSLMTSRISISQQLFGTYGRNTGLFTYLAFGTLLIGAAVATNRKVIKPFIIGTSAALLINVSYGAIQANGGDPYKWSNPYAPVIGTFGNPNFVSSFLGMGMAFALSYLVAPAIEIKFRIVSGFYILLALYDILRSDAQQGLVVSFLSFGLIGHFLLKAKFSKPIIRYSYLGCGLIVTLIGILGTLQKAPLSSMLYKPSVTYRGDYWHAGMEMFKSHPWLGVGLDAYGDYYRAARTITATLRRGPTAVSNAAHNVFIDIAATAGIFALLAYSVVILIGMRAAWRISKRSTGFDPFFVSIFVAWVGYLVQSVISINNIALGIWGWVLPGLLIAMDRWQTEEKSKVREIKSTDFTGMVMMAGLVIGGVIGWLPFNSDANFRYAIYSVNPAKIYTSAMKWPTDPARIMYAANIFEQNKMQDKAVELAREAVRLSPRNFDAWMYLYNAPSVLGNEKREILDRLKVLDPHNPDLAKLG